MQIQCNAGRMTRPCCPLPGDSSTPVASATNASNVNSVFAVRITSRRVSPTCSRLNVIVLSPSINPAIEAASSGPGVFVLFCIAARILKENAAGEYHRRRQMVEAAGQLHPRLSAAAWTMPSSLHLTREWMRSVLSSRSFGWILVPAPRFRRRRVYESLQGRPEVGLLPTPRRCHAILADAVRVHRCELRFHSVLADGRDQLPNRTRVQKLSMARTTCLVTSFVSRPDHADAQA